MQEKTGTRGRHLSSCVSSSRALFSLVPSTSKRLLRMVGGSEVGEGKREELAFD